MRDEEEAESLTFERDFSEDGDGLSLDLCGVVGSAEEKTIDRSR